VVAARIHRVRTPAQTHGDAAEAAVAADLERRGWTVLARNVRVGRGELDLVAIDGGPPADLVIVEVRWRASRGFGLGEETVDHRKRAHLRAAIARLLTDGLPGGMVLPTLPLRVDLVIVEPGERGGGAIQLRHHRAITL
jgi:Holliday junction resolvase-like predicted endonuclease